MSKESAHQNALAFEQLKVLLIELDKALKRAMGFTHTLRYRGISFNVSSTLVTPDVAPLAFVHFTEPVDPDGEEMAVARLYDRVSPLLTCEHHWISETEGLDALMKAIASKAFERGSTLHVCSSCTAYAVARQGTSLPLVGREGT